MIYKNAHELIDLIKKKELSSVELLEALLKRVEKVNPDLNAVVQLDADRALEKAKQAASPSWIIFIFSPVCEVFKTPLVIFKIFFISASSLLSEITSEESLKIPLSRRIF